MKPDAFSRQIIEKWMGYQFPEEITWNDVHEVIEEMETHSIEVTIRKTTCVITYLGKILATGFCDDTTNKMQAVWEAVICAVTKYVMNTKNRCIASN